MGNSNSKSASIGTKEVVAGLGILTVGIVGGLFWSGAFSDKTKLSKGKSNSSIAQKNLSTKKPTKDDQSVDSSTLEDSFKEDSIDKRRQTIYFKKDDLLPTDDWIEYSNPSLGVKFRHPKHLTCTLGINDTLSIISFSDPNSNEKNLQFMTIETQSEKIDPRTYSKNAIDLIRNMFPVFSEKRNNSFDFQGYDAFELQYQMSIEDKETQVWTTAISTDHVCYLMQCMSGDKDEKTLRISKTIVSTLEIDDYPSLGKVEVTTPIGLKLNLPSPYLKVKKSNSSEKILSALFSTNDEPLVEEVSVKKYDDLKTIEELKNKLNSNWSNIEEIDSLDLDQIKGTILKWSDNDFEYIGYIFIHNNTGYIVQYQIEESRLSQGFQKRTLDSLKSIKFTSPRNDTSVFYVHPKFRINIPLDVSLREVPLPLAVQIFHSNQEGKSIHTTVEFRELEQPTSSIEELDALLKEKFNEEGEVVPDQSIIENNGLKCIRTKLTAQIPDYSMMMMGGEPNLISIIQTAYLENSQNIICITSTCLKDELEKFKYTFEKIHNSFSF